MGPPSIIEFFLTLLTECAIGMASKKTGLEVHHATKGCVFDFTARLDDARLSVLNGFVCSSCRDALSDEQSDDLLKDSLQFGSLSEG